MRRGARAVAAALLCACIPAPAAVAAAAQPSGAPQVHLLDPGRAPREPLRFAATAGTSSTARLTTEVTVTQKLGDRSQTVNAPPITITLSTRVASVTPDDEATIDFSYDKVAVKDDGSLPEDQLAQVRQRLEPIAGITGSYTLSATGTASRTHFDIPSDVDPQARQLLEQLEEQSTQLAVPFPEQAVGKSARWTATQEIDVSGVTLRQTTRYQLKSRDGSRVKTRVHIDQRAENLRGTGAGTITADASQPLPTLATLHLDTRQRLRQQGQTLDLTVKTKLRFETAG